MPNSPMLKQELLGLNTLVTLNSTALLGAGAVYMIITTYSTFAVHTIANNNIKLTEEKPIPPKSLPCQILYGTNEKLMQGKM